MVLEIIFSHSGGMFPYYLGVAEVLKDYDLSNVIFSATSGGCFAPMVLNSGKNPRDVFDKILNHIGGEGSWETIIKEFIFNEFTEEELLQNNHKLSVKLTKLNQFLLPEKVNVDSWTSKQDFIDCIGAACYVPMMCGSKFYCEYRNQKIVDGFFAGTSELPITDNETLLISTTKWRPFTPHWLLPCTDADWLKNIYNLGYRDAMVNIRDIESRLTKRNVISDAIAS